MAADFWLSTHGNYWLFDRQTIANARREDLKYATLQELGWISIWSANVLHKLAKKLNLKQQVTATAVAFFRRFYLKNSYAVWETETEPCLVAAACLYVAAKAEELPVHIKSIVAESRSVFQEMGFTQFPTDNAKLAQMEFYLLEDLSFHLIVHHPYRSLIQFTGKDNMRRDNILDMDENALQMAWFIINDSYRSDLCLLYPPHIIALAAIYLAFTIHPPPLKQKEVKEPVKSPPTSNPNPISISVPAQSSKSSPPANVAMPLSSSINVDPSTNQTPAIPTISIKPKSLHPSLPARPDFSQQQAKTSINVLAAPSLSSSSSSSSNVSVGYSQPTLPISLAQFSNTQQFTSTSNNTSTVQQDASEAAALHKLDHISFLSRLNVPLALILEVIQDITALYTLWHAYEEVSTGTPGKSYSNNAEERVVKILSRMREAKLIAAAHP